MKKLIPIWTFLLGILVVFIVRGYFELQNDRQRIDDLEGYISLESKCEPIRAHPELYPYGPLGFRCDYRGFDGYVQLEKDLMESNK